MNFSKLILWLYPLIPTLVFGYSLGPIANPNQRNVFSRIDLASAVGEKASEPAEYLSIASIKGRTSEYVSVPAQQTINNASTYLPSGTYNLQSPVTLSRAMYLHGDGANTVVNASSSISAAIFNLSPTTGTDPKNWTIRDLKITNSGSAANTFTIDLSSAGQYISKLEISHIIAGQTSGAFVELINSRPNIDGLFTSVFQDNWSMNGYFLDNIGDSVIFQRNTTTGIGIGYYINQLGSASHIVIRDGNSTSAGGALNVVHGTNITFDNMQVETPTKFTGVNDAAVSASNSGSSLITNLRITNNNINTHGNPKNCIYLNFTNNATIDGNTLFADPSKGIHVFIGKEARDTYIGLNKYYSSVDGSEISARISDNGTGTMGIWKNATLASWSSTPANSFSAGYFKTRDGLVLLRGNLKGKSLSTGQTLFTLPIGFRPSEKIFTTYIPTESTNVGLQILPTGEVQILASGIFTVHLDGITFSTR